MEARSEDPDLVELDTLPRERIVSGKEFPFAPGKFCGIPAAQKRIADKNGRSQAPRRRLSLLHTLAFPQPIYVEAHQSGLTGNAPVLVKSSKAFA